MATFQAELPPIHNLGTAEEEVEKVKRYLVRLAEQLDYTINRLEPGSGEAAGLSATGVSPGSYGGGAQTPGFGDVFQVLSLVVDYYGRLTSVAEQNVTIPNTTATAAAAGLMSAADKTKLDGVEAGAAANVQPDWAEADTTSDAYIKNKPTIPPGSVVDSYLDPTSENPVQNKVITAALFQSRGDVNGDLDAATDPGVYTYASTDSNTPTASAGGALLVLQGPGTYLMQLAIPRDTSGDTQIYYRQYTSSNVWSTWVRAALPSEIPEEPATGNVALTATDTAVATIGGLRLYQYGKVRTLMGYITAVDLTTTLTTVTTIPAGHRPVAGTPLALYSTVTALASSVGIVNAAGTVQVRLASARTSGNIYIAATWSVS